MKTISVRGTIVPNDDKWIYDLLGIEAVSPQDIRKGLLEAAGDEVTLEVNSGGGDVFAANDIYYAASGYQGGRVVADITGLAASAATIICCGAAWVRAVPGAQYMVHNVSIHGASGDYHEMDHASQVLQSANKAVSNIYRAKTGMGNKELLKIMDIETWMDAEKAMSYGFIDEIIGDNGTGQPQMPFTIKNNASAVILSEEVKQRVRQHMEGQGRKGTPGRAEDASNLAGSPGAAKPSAQELRKLKGQLQIIRLRGGKR